MSQVYIGSNNGSSPATDLHVSQYIVNSNADSGGNYLTIASAYAAAVAVGEPATVFIMPGATGTYTENITLSPGINLVAFPTDDLTPTVTIIGKLSASFSGTVTISDLNLQTNSDYILHVTGANATIVNFEKCYIGALNNSAISSSTTNTGSQLNFYRCKGDLGTTGINYFSILNGTIYFGYCELTNSNDSTTANTIANASSCVFTYTRFDSAYSSSNTSNTGISFSEFLCGGLNETILTIDGTGDNSISFSKVESGTGSAISVGASAAFDLYNIVVNSDATHAITGSGTINYSPITFSGTSSNVNVTTQNPLRFGPQISPELANTNGTLYYDGTIINSVSPGTSGQVLTSNGSGSAPSYQAAGGGITEYFSAYLSAPVSNVTGDGTLYGPVVFNTTLSNTGHYNTATGVYTAPTTGQYCFQHTICFTGGDTLTTSYLTVWNGSVYSVRSYQIPANTANTATAIVSACTFIPMTAGDTMSITLLAGGTNKNVGVYGAAPTGDATTSTFSGFRVGT